MENSLKDKIVSIFAIIIALIVVGVSLYFFVFVKNKQEGDENLMKSVKDSLQKTSPETALETSLLKAEANLKNQTDKLIALQTEFGRQQIWGGIIVNSYDVAGDAIDNTDILFDDAESSKPKIKVKTQTEQIQIEINLKRKQMTEVLKLWKEEVLKVQDDESTNIASQNLIENYAKQVQSYLNDIQDIVSYLSPENSGLTQEQINSYVAVAQEAVQSINTVVSELASTASDENASSFYSGNYAPNSSFVPVVTQQEINNQQTAVNQAQNNVNELQTAVNQSQNSSSDNTASSSVPVQEQTNSETNQYFYYYDPDLPKNQSIYSDPGEPQLIQGAERED